MIRLVGLLFYLSPLTDPLTYFYIQESRGVSLEHTAVHFRVAIE
jgi:hypothetical protein